MASSYKSYVRRNEAIRQAHAIKSNSMDSIRSTVKKSIDSDLNKLQRQLHGYNQRRMSLGSSSPVLPRAQIPDIRMSSPTTSPDSPGSAGYRRYSMSSTTAMGSRSPSLYSEYSSDEHISTTGSKDSSLAELTTMYNSNGLLTNRFSKSAAGNLQKIHLQQQRHTSRPASTKSKLARQRSRSLDHGIDSIADITNFFRSLRSPAAVGREPGRRRESGDHPPRSSTSTRSAKSKRLSLPVIDASKSTAVRQRIAVPELIVTCEDDASPDEEDWLR